MKKKHFTRLFIGQFFFESYLAVIVRAIKSYLPNVSSMMRFRLFKTGEMEVKNPMFHDDPTPATPSQNHKEEEHM